MIKIGETYHILIPNVKMELYKIHILAIVENHVVYRWYGKHKQWWHYVIEQEEWLQTKIDRATQWKVGKYQKEIEGYKKIANSTNVPIITATQKKRRNKCQLIQK